MTPTTRGCVAALLCLAAAGSACAAEVTLAADDTRLWRVVYDEAADVSDVYARHTEGPWVRQARSRGRPAAVFAANGRLYAFFVTGGWAYYGPDAEGATIGTLWPADWRGRRVLTACAAADMSHAGGLYVLLGPPPGKRQPATAPVETRPTTAPSQTQPATRPASPAAALLARRGGQWSFVAGLDAREVDLDGRIYLADVPGKGLFLLVCTSQGWPKATFRCDVDAGTWTKVGPLPWEPDQRVGWWITAGTDLLAAGLSEAGPWVRRVDPLLGTLGDETAVLTHEGKPLPVDDFEAMSLAAFKLTLPVAWRDDDTWRLGIADAGDGTVTDVEPMLVPSGTGAEVHLDRWLQGLFVLTTVIVLVMLARRLKGTAAAGFSLPVELVPALWPVRMLAAALDALPLMVAVSIVGSLVAPQAVEQLPRRFSDMVATQVNDPLIGWLTLAWGSACVVYGILMEAIFGATPVKMLLGMRVVGTEGKRPPVVGVVLRNLTKPLELMLMPVFLVWPLLSTNRQRAGDMLGGTAVVTRASLEAFRGTAGAAGGGDHLGPPPPPPPA